MGNLSRQRRLEDAPHAKDRIVNVPLPAHAGDETFSRIADQIFKPMVQAFRPENSLIPAGSCSRTLERPDHVTGTFHARVLYYFEETF